MDICFLSFPVETEAGKTSVRHNEELPELGSGDSNKAWSSLLDEKRQCLLRDGCWPNWFLEILLAPRFPEEGQDGDGTFQLQGG